MKRVHKTYEDMHTYQTVNFVLSEVNFDNLLNTMAERNASAASRPAISVLTR